MYKKYDNYPIDSSFLTNCFLIFVVVFVVVVVAVVVFYFEQNIPASDMH